MATYCVSDIHGNGVAFDALMRILALKDDDTLYILGDIIDRGPDGIQLLKKIMKMPNVKLILGNHELMMIEYFDPSFALSYGSLSGSSTPVTLTKHNTIKQRWNQNSNHSTLTQFLSLPKEEQLEILEYLKKSSFHESVSIDGKKFYLVHAFPGETPYQEVWSRPEGKDAKHPVPETTVILGHTPVVLLEASDKTQQLHYFSKLECTQTPMRIIHSEHGWIDIDCGASYAVPGHALACLCLDNMAELYIYKPSRSREMKAVLYLPTAGGMTEHEVSIP